MKIKLWGVRGSIPTPLTGDIIEQKVRKVLSLAKPGDVTSKETMDEFLKTVPFFRQEYLRRQHHFHRGGDR